MIALSHPPLKRVTVATRFASIAALFSSAADSPYPARIEQAAALLITALKRSKKLLVFGNGGSAADAQHLCAELVVRFQSNRRALPAIALGCDTAVLTACGNDLDFKYIFSRQIQAIGAAGDVALACGCPLG